MVFSSLPFLFLFLTVVLLVRPHSALPIPELLPAPGQPGFYAYGEPVYVLIMIGSILVNFFAGLLMDKQSTQGRRRAVLVVGIVLNLAALGVFKYAGLFVKHPAENSGAVLPAGGGHRAAHRDFLLHLPGGVLSH
ncbi:MAG: hypothetical protein ACLR1T_15080 [Evtepia gabavorous]